jgi:Spy/CpxP family protein refolding chaperone
MSKIRTVAMGAVLAVVTAAAAGAQTSAKPDSTGRGMHDGGQHRGMMDGRGMRGMRGEGMGQGHLMADLKLTDAQKSRIKAIHEKYQPQFKALRDQGQAQFKALRDARQKGDTSAAARQRVQQQREQFRQRSLALRTQEQNEVRAVLTADQRAKWDAAQAQRKQRMEARRDKMKDRRDGRVRGKA